MRVRYVDTATRAQNIAIFPELDPAEIVDVHYQCDGFVLQPIPDRSQHFVIANHVLEHAPNPIGVLRNWRRVLRPGGLLFLSVPMESRSFDKGHGVTSLRHMVEDFELGERGELAELERRNLDHYWAWLNVSEPNLLRERGEPPRARTAEERAARVAEWARTRTEIHFHTFSRASFAALLEHAATEVPGGCTVLEVCEEGIEAVGVVQRDG
ncbi:MAG: methyltransferase domain-containing protein [Myxococcales bacterium]|nr:methyltransferase domain-containing protein [Myxococcales bacterium]